MRKVNIIFSIVSLLIVVLIQEYRPQISPTEKISFGFNEKTPSFSSDSLQLMSFGYPRVLSGLLWIRFLIRTPTERVPENQLSWIYFDLDSITNIGPDFLPAFELGGLFLSVITTDKKGAELLLKKGLKLHPNSWRLHMYMAYHYKIELDRKDLAGPYYIAGSKIPGAPPLMGILAARHLSDNSVDESILFLEKLEKTFDAPGAKEKIRERIEMWKKKKNGEVKK